jgi:hypothetical protein
MPVNIYFPKFYIVYGPFNVFRTSCVYFQGLLQ